MSSRTSRGDPDDGGERPPPDAEQLSLRAYGYILANARANPVRTGATISAVAVAVAFLIVVSSLSVGLEGATERDLLDYTVGTPELPISDFIQTQEGDFVGLFATRLFDPDDVLDVQYAAQQFMGGVGDLEVYPYCERVLEQTQLSGLDVLTDRLLAVDPEVGLVTPYTQYHDYLVLANGEHLDDPGAADVVLGYQLWAERFRDARPGDRIDLTPADGAWFESDVEDLRSNGALVMRHNPGLEGLRLRGVLDRSLSTDNNAYVPLGYFANVTGAGLTIDGPRCEAVSVEVEREGVDMVGLAEEMVGRVPRVSSYFVTTSTSLAKTQLAQALRASIYGWLLLATAVVLVGMTLGVANTSFLNVSQRVREIGTLRALGLTRQQVRNLVQWEALFIGMMGWVIGFFSGTILASSVLNVVFEAEDLGIWLAPGRAVPLFAIGSVIAVLVATLVGAEVPARRATALSPVDALSSPM